MQYNLVCYGTQSLFHLNHLSRQASKSEYKLLCFLSLDKKKVPDEQQLTIFEVLFRNPTLLVSHATELNPALLFNINLIAKVP